MPVLAFLLIRNVRAIIRRRVAPAGETSAATSAKPNNSAINQMDAQLTLMLVLESGIAAITYLPYATQLTYANMTQTTPKSAVRVAWESVFTELIHLFSYVFFASSFYVSFASNTGYRRQLRRVFFGKKRADHVNRSGTWIHRAIRQALVCQTKHINLWSSEHQFIEHERIRYAGYAFKILDGASRPSNEPSLSPASVHFLSIRSYVWFSLASLSRKWNLSQLSFNCGHVEQVFV